MTLFQQVAKTIIYKHFHGKMSVPSVVEYIGWYAMLAIIAKSGAYMPLFVYYSQKSKRYANVKCAYFLDQSMDGIGGM